MSAKPAFQRNVTPTRSRVGGLRSPEAEDAWSAVQSPGWEDEDLDDL
jgi:hypothetical protein